MRGPRGEALGEAVGVVGDCDEVFVLSGHFGGGEEAGRDGKTIVDSAMEAEARA